MLNSDRAGSRSRRFRPLLTLRSHRSVAADGGTATIVRHTAEIAGFPVVSYVRETDSAAHANRAARAEADRDAAIQRKHQSRVEREPARPARTAKSRPTTANRNRNQPPKARHRPLNDGTLSEAIREVWLREWAAGNNPNGSEVYVMACGDPDAKDKSLARKIRRDLEKQGLGAGAGGTASL